MERSEPEEDLSQCLDFPVPIAGPERERCDGHCFLSFSAQLSRDANNQPPRCLKAYRSQVRSASASRPLPCGIWRMTFEVQDPAALFEHLNDHFNNLNSNHRCNDRQIDFMHPNDLERHILSAQRGDCGFRFLHKSPCSGHHPPRPVRSEGLVLEHDNDRFSFCYRVRQWEQSQLQTFISSIQSLVAAEPKSQRVFIQSENIRTLNRCYNDACRNCRILRLYRRELNQLSSYPTNVASRISQASVDCCDVSLVKDATSGLVDHFTKGLMCARIRRRALSFSEGCASVFELDEVGSNGSESRAMPSIKLSNGAVSPDASYFTQHWQRILHRAAASGDANSALLALENGADVDGTDFDRKTALHLAAISGAQQVIETLIQAGASFGPPEKANKSPLEYAICQGWFAAAQLLLSNGAMGPSIENGRSIIHTAFNESFDYWLETQGQSLYRKEPHAEAAYHAYVLERLPILLEYGAPVDAVDKSRRTTLHVAAETGHCEAAKLLIDHGASLQILDKRNSSPLSISIKRRKFDFAQLLIDCGARAEDINLATAIRRDTDISFVGILLDRGARVNLPCDNLRSGPTPLVAACAKASFDVVKLLVERGADVNGLGSFGENAMIKAAAKGKMNVVQFLLANGSNLHLKAREHITVGSAVMDRAAEKGNIAIVQLLFENGVKVSDYSYGCLKTLCRTVTKGHMKVVRLLLEKGASLEAKNNDVPNDSHTPLP